MSKPSTNSTHIHFIAGFCNSGLLVGVAVRFDAGFAAGKQPEGDQGRGQGDAAARESPRAFPQSSQDFRDAIIN
jgi:hypothetical protein